MLRNNTEDKVVLVWNLSSIYSWLILDVFFFACNICKTLHANEQTEYTSFKSNNKCIILKKVGRERGERV